MQHENNDGCVYRFQQKNVTQQYNFNAAWVGSYSYINQNDVGKNPNI